jgi:hypothetical protein
LGPLSAARIRTDTVPSLWRAASSQMQLQLNPSAGSFMLYAVRLPTTSKMASESGAVQGNDGYDREVAFAPEGPVLQGCVK